MHNKLSDHVAISILENATAIEDGATSLTAYTRKMGQNLTFANIFKLTTDANATYKVELEESANNSDWSAVASAQVAGDVGTAYTQAQLAALGIANVALAHYLGYKKHVRVKVTVTGQTDPDVITVLALEGGSKLTPQ